MSLGRHLRHLNVRHDGDDFDIRIVDRLGRIDLALRARGSRLRLRDVNPELVAILELAGLADLWIEPRRQPEGGEQRGVEEVVVPDDPTA